MTDQVQRLAALAILHCAINGPDRRVDESNVDNVGLYLKGMTYEE